MISIDRFIVPSNDHAAWLRAREGAVTATQVAKSATPSGFEEQIAKIGIHEVIEDNAYMAFGRDNEDWIVRAMKNDYEILPNLWSICHEEFRWMTATPDALSLDHKRCGEVKTTGTDWGQWSKVPIHYRRQVQWQLFVTGAETCAFGWLLRAEQNGKMIPAWFEPKTVLVERDEKMISELVDVAHKLHPYILEASSKGKGN